MLLTVSSFPSGFYGLALELVQEILLNASHEEWGASFCPRILCSLRLVCKQFQYAADPFIFREIGFHFGGLPLDVVIDRLKSLAERKNPACRFARTLKIGVIDTQFLSPVYTGEFSFLLMRAIRSLQNIRVLDWQLQMYDCVYAILDGLSELPSLEELNLNWQLASPAASWTIEEFFPLRRFPRIKSIKIMGKLPAALAEDFVRQLRKLGTSGGLHALKSLQLDFPPRRETVHSVLHTILQGVPAGEKLILRELWVNGWTLQLDSVTLPHLRHLSSLHISNMQDQGLDTQRYLWNSMERARICLREISVKDISPPFLDYLSSYRGLETLTISEQSSQQNFHGGDAKVAHTFCRRLYYDVLPLHKDSLKKFHIDDQMDIRKHITADYAAMLQSCSMLESVKVTFDRLELDSEDNNLIKIVFSILQLPHLSALYLSYSRIGRTVGRRCDCANARVYRMANNKVNSIITALDIPVNWRNRRHYLRIFFNRDQYTLHITEGNDLRFISRREQQLKQLEESRKSVTFNHIESLTTSLGCSSKASGYSFPYQRA